MRSNFQKSSLLPFNTTDDARALILILLSACRCWLEVGGNTVDGTRLLLCTGQALDISLCLGNSFAEQIDKAASSDGEHGRLRFLGVAAHSFQSVREAFHLEQGGGELPIILNHQFTSDFLRFRPGQQARLGDFEDHVGGEAQKTENEDADKNFIGAGKALRFHNGVAEAGRRGDNFGDD